MGSLRCWVSCCVVVAGAYAQLGTNLILNGDAEAAAGSPDGFAVVAVPNWSTTSTFNVVSYAAGGGFPTPTDPGSPTRGANFFAGGPSTAFSTATQTVDLTWFAPYADAGLGAFSLSGWLGGWFNHADHAGVVAEFRDAANSPLGVATIGPVTVAERSSITSFLYRSATGAVPVGTRTVVVTVSCTRFAGTYDDGYADDLAFAVFPAATSLNLGGGCGALGSPTLTSTPPALGTMLTFTLAQASPLATGELLFSAPGAPPTPLPFGCTVSLDLNAFYALTPLATDFAGGWTFGLPVPSDPAFAGFTLVFQAYALPSAAPLGLDVSDALLLIVGL